jgi:hypothetical protein
VARSAKTDETVTERGVYWNRDRQGRVHWFYDETQQWVPWRPGADSPPPPPGWVPWSTRTTTRRLILRLAPVLLVIVILIVAVEQGSRGHKAARTVPNLVGSCLTGPRSSGASLSKVSCSSAKAELKVVATVDLRGNARPTCPKAATASVDIGSSEGLTTVECLAPVVH